MNRLLLIFLVVFVAVSVVSTSTSNFEAQVDNRRFCQNGCFIDSSKSEERVVLPSNLKPLTYNLKITPNLKDFTFKVEEEIKLSIQQDPSSVTQIIANAKDLKVHHASLYVNNQLKHNFQNITYDKENDYVIFHLENDKNLKDVLNLQVNDVFTLSLTLTGELNDKMTGFYRSKYYKEGEEKYAASTQFEPVSARRAFVCWDEPAIKAIFEVTLMSTYLVAFVIGKIAEDSKNKVKVRLYCPLGKKAQGLFALDVAIKVLALFENYFELSYPLKKLDMIAISSFSSAAMENFGLITFHEGALLVDPNNQFFHFCDARKILAYYNVATVVTHEISHQWFGNLVTMKWWDGLWLNEGFATWCESFAIDKLYPEWKVIEQSVRDDFYKAMSFEL
ncbi:hypothetical protein ABK040_002536 [Willaertia magna]